MYTEGMETEQIEGRCEDCGKAVIVCRDAEGQYLLTPEGDSEHECN